MTVHMPGGQQTERLDEARRGSVSPCKDLSSVRDEVSCLKDISKKMETRLIDVDLRQRKPISERDDTIDEVERLKSELCEATREADHLRAELEEQGKLRDELTQARQDAERYRESLERLSEYAIDAVRAPTDVPELPTDAPDPSAAVPELQSIPEGYAYGPCGGYNVDLDAAVRWLIEQERRTT